ncbi:S-adenosyl-L-methionine-dependent methyltransferase [Cryphonectria parasitica EP155]|uniref:S-adenosyl-L-methionine-dependent methyltransferase n=1 Tax=Cryphonectria parasitica (strain ATCC 38755 / EP155) TaxID=660469 RepID=A0A9P5CR86_CRYP1|nr:S-adenosyl-L-methionine-dependent methyltransferase [Cryphonectria parasitica EP155]KAF3767016.1 S-adenosyl-L-methionine-dependent methyltransferase [Cryphonectria parasitica EP155]
MSTAAEHTEDPGKSASSPASAAVSEGGPTNSPPAPTTAEGLAPQATEAPQAVETSLLPATHWTQLAQDQADEIENDADSAFGDVASSTDSITSSILEYRTIHGRTYHSDSVPGNAQYWGSNDSQQTQQMDINHHFLTLCTDNKLYFAPIGDDVQKILDVGTGTGTWAMDFADDHPETEVIGTDISPIQPQWIPPNLRFEIEDCTSEWTFAPTSFDYIHMRYLVGSIIDWTVLFKEAFTALKPGGWLESFEGSPHMVSDDNTVPENSAIAQWGRFFEEGGKKIGRSFIVVEEGIQKKAMEEAGFVDIQEWELKAPVGGWPQDKKLKELGTWAQTSLLADIEGLVLFVANVINGWTREEVLVYIAHLRREVRSNKHHAYFKVKAVWGRKPEDA